MIWFQEQESYSYYSCYPWVIVFDIYNTIVVLDDKFTIFVSNAVIRSAAARCASARIGITIFPEEHQNLYSLFICK
jgi:hypothetical protein